MAIPMPIQQDIRRYDRQGMPHARIARELGVDRGTVAKYAKQEDCSPQPKRDRRFGRKTDAYAALIDQMLEADRMMPRKQRHTARRIFDRLVAEHGFDGSYSVVRRYVKEWHETNRESSHGYLRLEWDPGVMQVDFGVALADVAGAHGAFPGGHVAILEHALRGGDARGERRMPVFGSVDGVRTYGRRAVGAGDGQRHGRGPPRLFVFNWGLRFWSRSFFGFAHGSMPTITLGLVDWEVL